jgi:DNA polymerase III subunit epsilon
VSSRGPFVAFDVETTGLIPGVDRIIELAGVAFQDGQVLDETSCLVDPGIPIPAAASGINGISDEMVRGRPSVAAELPGFIAFLSRGTPVAHNASFDAGFISAALEEAGLPGPAGPILDTRGLARRAFPRRSSYSLGNLARDLGIEERGAHRALADARTCMRLFLACVGSLGRDREPSLAELVRWSGPETDLAEHAPRAARVAALLRKAIDEEAMVDISYRSARGEVTDRRILPLDLSIEGGAVVVRAFCTFRNAERTFRLESIVEARRPV